MLSSILTRSQRPTMHPLLWTSVVSFLVVSTLPAQTKTIAERLGHPADSKLLIIHADDLAVAHSVDVATFDALEKGAISSASVMVPSLLDSAGTFPMDEKVVAATAKPLEVEREIRAQIDRALALGIRPTHIDSHMGALFTTPELIATYVKVARDYRLPFLALRGDPHAAPQPPLTDKDVLLDAVITAGPEVPRDQWKAFYLKSIANLKPGLTEIIVHLGRDDSELQAVTVNHQP